MPLGNWRGNRWVSKEEDRNGGVLLLCETHCDVVVSVMFENACGRNEKSKKREITKRNADRLRVD